MADPEKAMEVENEHEDVEDEEVDGDNAKQVSELLKNPALMEALQGKLGQMVGMNSGYIAVIFVYFLQNIFLTFYFKKFMMNAIVALTPLIGNPPCIQNLFLIIYILRPQKSGARSVCIVISLLLFCIFYRDSLYIFILRQTIIFLI